MKPKRPFLYSWNRFFDAIKENEPMQKRLAQELTAGEHTAEPTVGSAPPPTAAFLDTLIMDLSATVAVILGNLKTSENTRLTRPDIGYKVSGFYNWPYHIRVDIVRLDKEKFFS